MAHGWDSSGWCSDSHYCQHCIGRPTIAQGRGQVSRGVGMDAENGASHVDLEAAGADRIHSTACVTDDAAASHRRDGASSTVGGCIGRVGNFGTRRQIVGKVQTGGAHGAGAVVDDEGQGAGVADINWIRCEVLAESRCWNDSQGVTGRTTIAQGRGQVTTGVDMGAGAGTGHIDT